MEFKIAKFGGTSMARCEVILQSAKVLLAHPEIKVCVISATSGSTNQLYMMGALAKQNQYTEALGLFDQFSQRHQQIMLELQASEESVQQMTGWLERIKEILLGIHLLRQSSESILDELVSHGELISSRLFFEALRSLQLPVQWIDARIFMKTNSQFGSASPQLELISKEAQNLILPYIKDNKIVVTQGYIGSDLQGQTTTLGKEGSDYSTALIGEALGAQEIQIWKDVAGVMTTDPRLCSRAHTLPEMSYTEVMELTRFGAKVIHPDTMLAAMRAKIPIYVGYSQIPQTPGTLISSQVSKDLSSLRAISLKRNQHLLTIQESAGKWDAAFSYNIMQFLFHHRLRPHLIQIQNQKASFIFDHSTQVTHDVLRELENFGDFQITNQLDLIAMVGENLLHSSLFQEIYPYLSQFKILFSSIGASAHGACLIVDAGEGEKILHTLHRNFLETQDIQPKELI